MTERRIVPVARVHRFVVWDRVPDYLRLGWLALPTLEGTGHGLWAVHLVWLCGCDVAEPRI